MMHTPLSISCHRYDERGDAQTPAASTTAATKEKRECPRPRPPDPDPHVQASPAESHGTAATQPAGDVPSTPPPMPGGIPPAASEPVPPTHRERPWGWIAVAGLLTAGVIGLGIYALNLNSDLDDADAQIASQQKQIDQAQETGAEVVESAQNGVFRSERHWARRRRMQIRSLDNAAQAQEAGRAGRSRRPRAPPTRSRRRPTRLRRRPRAPPPARQSLLSAFGLVFSGSTIQEGVEAAVAEF